MSAWTQIPHFCASAISQMENLKSCPLEYSNLEVKLWCLKIFSHLWLGTCRFSSKTLTLLETEVPEMKGWITVLLDAVLIATNGLRYFLLFCSCCQRTLLPSLMLLKFYQGNKEISGSPEASTVYPSSRMLVKLTTH